MTVQRSVIRFYMRRRWRLKMKFQTMYQSSITRLLVICVGEGTYEEE